MQPPLSHLTHTLSDTRARTRQVMKLQDQDIKAGRIEYETGSVEVEVAFTVLLFRPFRNEIIDAQVTTVTEVRGLCRRVMGGGGTWVDWIVSGLVGLQQLSLFGALHRS